MPKTTIKSWLLICFIVLGSMVFAPAQEEEEEEERVINEAERCNLRGVQETGAGKYGAALASFSRAIALQPNFAKAHYNLGTVYYHLKEYAKAVRELEKAIEINPAYP